MTPLTRAEAVAIVRARTQEIPPPDDLATALGLTEAEFDRLLARARGAVEMARPIPQPPSPLRWVAIPIALAIGGALAWFAGI